MSSTISSSTTTPTTSTSTSSAGTSASTAAAASSVVTSQGIGSGLNIGAIVSVLTTAFGAAQNNQIQSQQTQLDSNISAFGTFTSALDTLQSSLSSLEDPAALAGFTATVGDKTIASATATSGAVAGTYTLAVKNIATAASLSSGPVASAASTVGTGTLEITVGANSAAINIDSTDNTLQGIASAINSASNNPGVTASILTTTGGARLVLSGTTTGAANAITVTQSGGDGGLSALAYDPTNGITNLTQTQAATDANFTINGYPATSGSNLVSSAISGVTLDLAGPSAAIPGTPPTLTPTTLTIAADPSTAQTSINSFVTALNGVLSTVQNLTGYDATTQTAGALQGNATLEGFQNQLENIIDEVKSSNPGGVQSLTDLGLTANAQGTYDTNASTLSNVLGSSLASVGTLLGGTNGLATQLDTLITQYTQPGGLLATINTGFQTGLSNLANQQTQLNAELATYSDTLTTEYNAMDTAVASLKETQTYLNAEFNPSANNTTSAASSSLSTGTTST